MSPMVTRLRALPPVRQRLIAGAILAVAVLGVPALLLGPVVAQHIKYANTVAEHEHRLERSYQALDRMPRLEAELAGLEQALERSGLYIEGSRPTLAAAELQQILSGLADRAGVSIGSTNVRSPQEGPHATRIAVRLDLSGTIDELGDFLHAVEGHDRLLMVTNLTIQPDARRARGRRDPTDPVALDIRLDVAALMRGEGTL